MSNGSEHTPERCVHAVDGPDWAGLREPVSWKERALAAETEVERWKKLTANAVERSGEWERAWADMEADRDSWKRLWERLDATSEKHYENLIQDRMDAEAYHDRACRYRREVEAWKHRAVHAELEWSEAAARLDAMTTESRFHRLAVDGKGRIIAGRRTAVNDAAAAKAWEAHTAAMRAAHPWIQGTIEGRGNFIEGFKAGAEWARLEALREAADIAKAWGRENEDGGYARTAFTVARIIRSLEGDANA